MDIDIQDTERIKIAKPVASRPSHSTYKSFMELLAGAIEETPESSPKASLIPIRPKTVRFKPTVNRLRTPSSAVSSQAETSGTATNLLAENVPKLDAETRVIYKPLARLVSKTTVSLLAKMGSFEASNHTTQELQPSSQRPVKDKSSRKPQLSLIDDRSAASGGVETHQIGESLHTGASLNAEDGKKYIPAVANCDCPAYDVYNWRKYGQKLVKGSEYPRSYYKCTHPGCPVKKKVERSLHGEITEIVYEGEHNHLKPQPAKRGSSSLPAEPATDGIGQDDGNPISSTEALGQVDNGMETRLAEASDFSFPGKGPTLHIHSAGDALGQAGIAQDISCGEENVSKGKELADFEPRSNRRRNENWSEEAGLAEQDVLDPSATKSNLADADKLSDGFRWRKYGQKVVKGNPYPRSYYRCTSLECNVRKYVERVSDDPRSFVTTYEGKHNHEMHSKSNNNNNKNTNNS